MRPATLILLCLLATGAPLLADLCAPCSPNTYPADIGKCTRCGGATTSGAFPLCPKCSKDLNQYEHCRKALISATRPATAPARATALLDGYTPQAI